MPTTMSSYDQSVLEAFRSAWDRLCILARTVPVRHVNESVFRFLFIESFLGQNRRLECDDEWKRLDLLVRGLGHQAAVEFKFYDSKPLRHVDGRVTWKGGPGERNLGEFLKAVEDLRTLETRPWYAQTGARIDERYVVLVAVDRPERGARGLYSTWYLKPKVHGSLDILCVLEGKLPLDDLPVFGWVGKIVD